MCRGQWRTALDVECHSGKPLSMLIATAASRSQYKCTHTHLHPSPGQFRTVCCHQSSASSPVARQSHEASPVSPAAANTHIRMTKIRCKYTVRKATLAQLHVARVQRQAASDTQCIATPIWECTIMHTDLIAPPHSPNLATLPQSTPPPTTGHASSRLPGGHWVLTSGGARTSLNVG